jgi:hypothetical protein
MGCRNEDYSACRSYSARVDLHCVRREWIAYISSYTSSVTRLTSQYIGALFQSHYTVVIFLGSSLADCFCS